jgi:hypothetical protein
MKEPPRYDQTVACPRCYAKMRVRYEARSGRLTTFDKFLTCLNPQCKHHRIEVPALVRESKEFICWETGLPRMVRVAMPQKRLDRIGPAVAIPTIARR